MIYTVLGWLVVVLLSYIVIMQPKVKAGNEILEIQQKIVDLENSIKEHQTQHKNAVDEKEECINECTITWDKQADDEHILADKDRAEIKLLEERLGLLMQR